jgi:hypothetical protein
MCQYSAVLRKPLAWLLGVLVIMIALGVATWVAVARHDAGQIAVTWSSASPECSGTTVRNEPTGPVIEARAGMRCVVTVEVTNNGSRTVRLTSATAPYVGPTTGTVIAASNASNRRGSTLATHLTGRSAEASPTRSTSF